MLFLFPVVMMVGMVLGYRMRDTLLRRNETLERVIDLVNEKYVDTVKTRQLYIDAAFGILKSLDPHTVYIPAEELQTINEDLEGEFSGIGIEFSIVRDTVEVTSVVDEGPADQAGMEIGDQLIRVEDSLIAGRDIESDDVVRMLKGKQDSRVTVTVRRSGGALAKLSLTRDIIPIYSIDASIMLDDATGYIKINRFSATTHDEFAAALKKLITKGAQQLVIDLRGNPGGYIDAATGIADELLDSNKLIVYTSGVHSPKKEYKARTTGLFEKGKVAVLVDESSASASEILAGAIQDWDRGVIIGRRTFGKGLVQEQYDLPDGAALRLTVARYYTPSGRCIQRSFADGRDAYEQDYEKRLDPASLCREDTAANGDTVAYHTSSNRLVYGGGGIKPDVHVPYDTSLVTGALLDIVYSEELKTAIWDYFIRNKGNFKYRNIADFNETFNAQEQVTGSYLQMLKPGDRGGVLAELSKPFTRDFFRTQIKAQLARFLFRDNGYYTISLKQDDVVLKALKVLNSDGYLAVINRK